MRPTFKVNLEEYEILSIMGGSSGSWHEPASPPEVEVEFFQFYIEEDEFVKKGGLDSRHMKTISLWQIFFAHFSGRAQLMET